MANLWVEALAAHASMLELEEQCARRWQSLRMCSAFAARVREIQGLPAQAEKIVIWRPQPYVAISTPELP